MKAMVFHEHGGPDVLVMGEVDDPVPGAGEVLVDVRACALNHLDIFVRRGIPGLELPFPHVGGSDISGVVEKVGDGVEGLTRGDRVLVNPSTWCGRCEACLEGQHPLCDHYRILGEHLWGGFAEQVVAPASSVLGLPDHVSFEEGAAVPLTFQTAWRALFTQARLRVGETILILGASGGVASAAVQMAKLAGATVYAVTSGTDKVSKTRALGADVVIDRTGADFSKEIWKRTSKRGVDVVLENVGAVTWARSLRCLARGGRLVTYGATTGPTGETLIPLLFWKQLEIRGTTMGTAGEFRAAMQAFFDGKLEATISEVRPLEELRAAHETLERGEQFGKIVLTTT